MPKGLQLTSVTRSWCAPFLFLSLAMVALSTTNVRAAELVMIESAHCHWCDKWNEEIGVVYAKTAEGRRAPLRRIDIDQPLPQDLAFLGSARYTPTFVLVDGGREIGQIRGYPGEDFFWPMLQQLLKKLPSRSTHQET